MKLKIGTIFKIIMVSHCDVYISRVSCEGFTGENDKKTPKKTIFYFLKSTVCKMFVVIAEHHSGISESIPV